MTRRTALVGLLASLAPLVAADFNVAGCYFTPTSSGLPGTAGTIVFTELADGNLNVRGGESCACFE
jgi:hypothetical protein